MKMKVRQIITLKGWIEGSGWSYSDVYDDQVFEIDAADINSMDWDWWETDADNPPAEEEDTKIIVDLYAEDADIDEDKPLASFEKWESEIWTERHAE
jgi:hypothetical protein